MQPALRCDACVELRDCQVRKATPGLQAPLRACSKTCSLANRFHRRSFARTSLLPLWLTRVSSFQDPELLKFIDIECFIWSTVSADLTPMINAGMVREARLSNQPTACHANCPTTPVLLLCTFGPITHEGNSSPRSRLRPRPHASSICPHSEPARSNSHSQWLNACLRSTLGPQVFCDRHYGGINYPLGGVGRLGELLAEGAASLMQPAFVSLVSDARRCLFGRLSQPHKQERLGGSAAVSLCPHDPGPLGTAVVS